MENFIEKKLLRVFVSEADKFEHKPLYEKIVLKAKELGLAGATVTRGIMGFGLHSKLHYENILRISEELPIIIEVMDEQAKIETLLPFLEEAMSGGIICLEDVKVMGVKA